jgi:hypothetical protein
MFSNRGNQRKDDPMVFLRQHGSDSRLRRMVKRSPLALLPLLTVGSLAVAPTAALASTPSPLASQAASSGVPSLDPTLIALEAEVTAAVNEVLTAPLPLVASLSCVPYYVTAILGGGRIYPC